jgi:transposase
MPRAYSGDMRQRVIAEVESGASRREAAEEFEVSASTAIIWVKCFDIGADVEKRLEVAAIAGLTTGEMKGNW